MSVKWQPFCLGLNVLICVVVWNLTFGNEDPAALPIWLAIVSNVVMPSDIRAGEHSGDSQNDTHDMKTIRVLGT